MTLAQKISGFGELWKLAMPHIEPPSVQDSARWGGYPRELVERAILRTARRFAPNKIPPAFRPDEAYRYTSAVAKGESKGYEAHAPERWRHRRDDRRRHPAIYAWDAGRQQ
jgi:hypothetical protein